MSQEKMIRVRVRNIDDEYLTDFCAKFIKEEREIKVSSNPKLNEIVIHHIYEISESNLERMKMDGLRSLDKFYGITII